MRIQSCLHETRWSLGLVLDLVLDLALVQVHLLQRLQLSSRWIHLSGAQVSPLIVGLFAISLTGASQWFLFKIEIDVRVSD